MSSQSSVGSLVRLSNKVMYWSWASCALALFVSYFSVLEVFSMSRLDQAEAYSWEVDYIDPTLALSAGVGMFLYLIFFVASAIYSLRWIYRANANAHCLNDNLEMSPGSNVGWFFVPLATYWKPYEGIKEVWRVSANPQDPHSVERPSLMVKWWTFWVLTNITATASFRLEWRATEVSTAILADIFDIVSSIALVPATYYFLAVVRDITEKQQRFAPSEEVMSVQPDLGSA